jgi:ribonuclease P protein component
MLSKSHRLTKKEFLDVYKKKVFFTPFFAVHAINSPTTKFSIVISRKNAKKAVTRNAQKRKYYLALESYLNRIKNPFWCIFLVNKKGLELQGAELDQELGRILNTVEKTCSKI